MDEGKRLHGGELIAGRGLADTPLRGERRERLAHVSGANAAGVTELGKGERPIGVGEHGLECVGRRASSGGRYRHRVDDLQREGVADAA